MNRSKSDERKALCIGINDYPGLDSDLAGCVNDVNDWANLLDSKNFVVKTLIDKQATREHILANLKILVTEAIAGDLLVVQYSGHGTQVPDENSEEEDRMDEAWVPYDVYENGPVFDDEIWKILRTKKPETKIIFISDSCHSGSVVRAFGQTFEGRKKFVPFSKFSDQMNLKWYMPVGTRKAFERDDEKVPWPCLLLAGCQDVEYSYDADFKGRANGAFTYWALAMLKNLKQVITYQEWYDMVRTVLPSKQHPQSPNILGSYKNHKIFE